MLNRNQVQELLYLDKSNAKDIIDDIYDGIGSCNSCMYSEKTTNTRWKCEWLDNIRVRPTFFCADYIRRTK